MSQSIPDVESGDHGPRSTAIAWFSRQRSGQMTEEDRVLLRQWLDQDPGNREAYRSVRAAWTDLGAVRTHPRVMTMREGLAGDKIRKRRKFIVQSLAACLAIGFIVLSGAAAWEWWTAPRPLANQTFATVFGERATIRLPDGSELTLNTDTVVRTRADADRRLLYLEKGQAYFKVAKDAAHPFVVTAGDRTITALGTAFDVRVDGGGFKVTLVEGKVRVENALASSLSAGLLPGSRAVQATEMTPGTQLVAPGNGEWRLTPTNAAAETSWTKGQLIFDDEPLGEVVAELNRYSKRRMVVPDEALQDATISGNFKPGDVDGFVHALEEFGVARAVRLTDGSVQLRPLS